MEADLLVPSDQPIQISAARLQLLRFHDRHRSVQGTLNGMSACKLGAGATLIILVPQRIPLRYEMDHVRGKTTDITDEVPFAIPPV
jgi:hypothetical protein